MITREVKDALSVEDIVIFRDKNFDEGINLTGNETPKFLARVIPLEYFVGFVSGFTVVRKELSLKY